MSDEVELVEYDEMSMFHENAEEYGIPYDGPPAVERVHVEVEPGRRLSALVWGDEPPELVLLHGGAQNAHTWDTVALALGRPLVAIDLPGHGHSDGGRNGSFDLDANADDIAAVVRRLAPDARCLVGMSLGGMTALALAHRHPDLVRRLVLVDVTPGVDEAKSSSIAAFINGPESLPQLRRAPGPHHRVQPDPVGVLAAAGHPPQRRAAARRLLGVALPPLRRGAAAHPQFGDLWEAVSALQVPLLLVRGMRPQSVVDDADEAELRRRQPTARVIHVEEAGHSVQGDSPVELAGFLADFAAG